MGRIFIIVILLYLLFLALYLLWERAKKRKWNAAKKSALGLFRAAPKEDIIGKSTFTLGHSRTQADTLKISEKAPENTYTFADENAKSEVQNTPVAEPADEPNEPDPTDSEDDDSGEIEINDYEPEGEYEPEEERGIIDYEESEDADEAAGVSMAQGVSFNELAGMVKTVDNADDATQEEREEAGRVLVEVRKTDLFEQVVSGEPKKKGVAGKLMDDFFADWHRRHPQANPEGTVKAPENFNVRSFA